MGANMSDAKTQLSRASFASKVSLTGQQALQAKRFLNGSRKEPEINSNSGNLKSNWHKTDGPYVDMKPDKIGNINLSKSIDAARPGLISSLSDNKADISPFQ